MITNEEASQVGENMQNQRSNDEIGKKNQKKINLFVSDLKNNPYKPYKTNISDRFHQAKSQPQFQRDFIECYKDYLQSPSKKNSGAFEITESTTNISDRSHQTKSQPQFQKDFIECYKDYLQSPSKKNSGAFEITELTTSFNWRVELLRIYNLLVEVFYDTIIVSLDSLFWSTVRLFKTDPIETLHSLLPQIHSEINPRTVTRLVLYCLAVRSMRIFLHLFETQILWEYPAEMEKYAGKHCPCIGNVVLCEKIIYAAREGLWFTIIEGFIFYLAMIQGAKLKRQTFYKINLLLYSFGMINVVRWRHMWNEIWWAITKTKAFESTETDSDPIIVVVFHVMTATFLTITIAYFSFMDAIKKRQEWKEWESEEQDESEEQEVEID